jgi:hypothetical protein
MQPDFDRQRFSQDVARWLKGTGLSYRAAASLHPGLNPAMLSRACAEQVLSAASILLLCRVVGLDPMLYLVILDKKNQAVTAIAPRETSGGNGGHPWA